MNPEDDELPDELMRDYRRASAAEAGRPAAATRAAILAEARAAALRRQPAANDSVIWWRAAASVAVVGVGLLIWRQVDRPVAPLAPATNVVRVESSDAGTIAATETEITRQSPQPQVQTLPRILDATAQAKSRAPAAESAAPAPPAAAASGAAAGAIASAAASAAAEKLEKRAERDDRASAQALDASPSPARSTLARSEPSAANAANLLRDRFPVEFASRTPPRALWVLQDAGGEVLRSGRLDDNEEFTAVTRRLQPEYPRQGIGPWSVTPVPNAQGVAVQIGVAVVR